MVLAAVRGLPGNLGFLHQLLGNQYILSGAERACALRPKAAGALSVERLFAVRRGWSPSRDFSSGRRYESSVRRDWAGDGLQNNTVFLLCQGWGVRIEGNLRFHERQRRAPNLPVDSSRLRPVHGFATRDNINELIADAGGLQGLPIDLLSIESMATTTTS
jgi:hypothetical protein